MSGRVLNGMDIKKSIAWQNETKQYHLMVWWVLMVF